MFSARRWAWSWPRTGRHGSGCARPGGAQTTASQEREPDVRAITDLLASFVKAYNEKDAKALGALFTPDAEIQDEDGDVTQGREAIVARFAGIFKENGDTSLGVDADSLRFLGTDLAIEEGTASLSTGAETPPRTNRYSVIYARQGGRWLHALIRDEPPEDDPHERLEELEWMLGEWVNESDDGIVKTSCKWSDDGNFLLREFDVKVEGRIALAAPSASAGMRSGSSSGCGSSTTGEASPKDWCRATATAGSSRRRESARTDDRSRRRTRSRRWARIGSSGRHWSGRSAARSCPALTSSIWSAPRPARQVKSHDRPSVEHPRRQHNLSGGGS